MANKFAHYKALDLSRDEARFIKNEGAGLNNLISSSQATVDQLLDFYDRMLGAQTNLDEIRTDGGAALVQYIKDQLNDQVFDPVATFDGMNTELGNTVTMIFNNIPKDGSNNVAARVISGTTPTVSTLLSDVMTGPQITAFQAQLTTLIASAQAYVPNN